MKKQIAHIICVISIVFISAFGGGESRAQCLNTELDNPAFWQTFGTSHSPGDSLPAHKTMYLYTPGTCPAEGYNTLCDSVPTCGAYNWRAVPVIPANGYYMLINAGNHSGDVYVDTAYDLCGNTNYHFSADVFNVTTSLSCGGYAVKPYLALKVETLGGVTLGQFNYVYDTIGTQSSVYFRTPAGIEKVVVRITSLSPPGCGNSFMLDHLIIAPCGPMVQAIIRDHISESIDLCVGDPSVINLFAKVGPGYDKPGYQWQLFDSARGWVNIFGATQNFYNRPPTGAGVYRYRLVVAEEGNTDNPHCRINSNEVTINVNNPRGGSAATNNGPVCVNSKVMLSATGGVSYLWSGPGGYHATEAQPTLIASHAAAGTYSVTVTDNVGCQSKLQTIVTVLAPKIVVNGTQTICLGNSAALQASGGVTYSWSPTNNLSNPAISNPTANPITTTLYTVAVTDSTNCSDTASVLLTVNKAPVISAGKDKVTIKGQPVLLDGSITNAGNVNFIWSPASGLNDAHILTPLANPATATAYVLTALSGAGCGASTDTVLVTVYKDFYIPSAFTPNGDGRNDTWHIPALSAFPDAVTSVYNRWGQKIFESKGGNKNWDGTSNQKTQPAGTYVYIIDLKNNAPIFKGTVVLIR